MDASFPEENPVFVSSCFSSHFNDSEIPHVPILTHCSPQLLHGSFTHESGRVVIFHRLRIPERFQDGVGLQKLAFQFPLKHRKDVKRKRKMLKRLPITIKSRTIRSEALQTRQLTKTETCTHSCMHTKRESSIYCKQLWCCLDNMDVSATLIPNTTIPRIPSGLGSG